MKVFANFQKKYEFLRPLLFFECENFAAHAPCARQKSLMFSQWASENISDRPQCAQFRKSKKVLLVYLYLPELSKFHNGKFHISLYVYMYIQYLPEFSMFYDEKFHISLPHVEQFLSLLFIHPSHNVRNSMLSWIRNFFYNSVFIILFNTDFF